MKSGNINYWESQLDNSNCLDLTLLIFFTWATPKTIIQVLPILSSKIESLSEEEYLKIADGIAKTSNVSRFTKSQQRLIENAIKSKQVSNSVKYLLSCRLEYKNREKFIHEFITDYSGVMQVALELKLEYLVNKFLANTTDNRVLDEVKDVYSKIKRYNERHYYYGRHWDTDSIRIPLKISKNIMRECKSYPRLIGSLAEKSCRAEANKHLKPVGEIAEKDKWFDYEGN